MQTDRLSIAQAGLRLGLTYQQVRAKLLAGELEGGEDDKGRFYVLAARKAPDRGEAERSHP